MSFILVQYYSYDLISLLTIKIKYQANIYSNRELASRENLFFVNLANLHMTFLISLTNCSNYHQSTISVKNSDQIKNHFSLYPDELPNLADNYIENGVSNDKLNCYC